MPFKKKDTRTREEIIEADKRNKSINAVIKNSQLQAKKKSTAKKKPSKRKVCK